MRVVSEAYRMRLRSRDRGLLCSKFEVTEQFIKDFYYVWGVPPVCSSCGEAIEPGDVVRWAASRKRESKRDLRHEVCRKKVAVG